MSISNSISSLEAFNCDEQLALLDANLDSYWSLQTPCDEATLRYLQARPFEIQRFQHIIDEVKARVLVEQPYLIHRWIKDGVLCTPVEPQGFKYAVMRELLLKVKNWQAFRLVQKTIGNMRAVGYQWPEFEAILKSTRCGLERRSGDKRFS